MERLRITGKSRYLDELAERAGFALGTSTCSSAQVIWSSDMFMEVQPVDRLNFLNVVIMKCDDDYYSLDRNVKVIITMKGVCNEAAFDAWNICQYVQLKELIVGDECFQYVKDLKIVGLNELEKMQIGKESFCKTRGGAFELKDCEALESVQIGDGSFTGVMSVVFESECCTGG